MALVAHEPADSSVFGELAVSEQSRALEVGERHKVLADFLQTHRFDAIVLSQPHNFAWFTCGGDSSRGGSSFVDASLFVTHEARVLVTGSVDSAQFFENEIPGLGFQLKERPWPEPRHVLLDDLCRGRTVASDIHLGTATNVASQIDAMRVPFTDAECDRLRVLGRIVSHAVEATARNFTRGETEAEVAGQLAHRLLKHEVVPERLQVCADGKSQTYRHWSFTQASVDNFATISAIGRKWGLCVGATRTIAFGRVPSELQSAHHGIILMQATAMYFSQVGWELGDTWKRVQRIYEKFDYPDEWRLADQGSVIGYLPREVPVVPDSGYQLQSRTPMFWHPSAGPASVGDTMLALDDGFEVITPTDQWPEANVAVKGTPIPRADILVRNA